MTRLDAFDGDAQAQPPDGELGEVEQRVGRGEGNAIVGAHAGRQAALFKQARKDRFEAEDGGLHLLRQLVAVTPGSARTVGQSFQTGFFVTIENLVAGLARDSELPTKRRHFLPVQQAGHKTNTFIHNRTLLPRHHSLP